MKEQSVVVGVRRWLRSNEPAKPSSRFHHLQYLAELGIRWVVIIYLRVSTQQQADKGYLKSQRIRVCKAVKEAGFKIARCDGEEVILTEVSEGKVSRSSLEFLEILAEELCAIIVAEDVSRFIRAKDFHPIFNPSAQLTENDIDEFRQKYKRSPFATIIHPDANYREIKKYQKEFGTTDNKPKKHKSGYKKRRRDKKLPKALRLYKKGASLGKISRLIKVAKSTVADWVKTYSQKPAT